MQPTWTNDQPRMGVPIWLNDPMQAKVFSTDGMMGEIRKWIKTLIYEYFEQQIVYYQNSQQRGILCVDL